MITLVGEAGRVLRTEKRRDNIHCQSTVVTTTSRWVNVTYFEYPLLMSRSTYILIDGQTFIESLTPLKMTNISTEYLSAKLTLE